jgi:hypothetical protein
MQQIATLEKDSRLALALASGASISEAASQANVERSTIYRKLEHPEFRRQVAEFRDRLISTALGRLADNMTRAADALTVMLDAPEPHIRLRAIRMLITLGIRLRDSVDFNTRMGELETELERKLGGTP